MRSTNWPPPSGQPPVPLPPPWPAPRRFEVPPRAFTPSSRDAGDIPGVVGSPWQWETTPTRPAGLIAWAESEARRPGGSGRVRLLLAVVLGVLLLGAAVVLL
ncbi:MAG: hypothetical protein ACH36H_09880 [Candidatus Nanopelagicales bacterium]